ncbi:hypothetical protein DCC79_04315 [bacterium]|nr:hypothetical protein [Chloroflexi bacterium CFX6]RIL11620.1 MAG: hypothetical protein DCC79_04315 [bacterium]
MTERANKRIDTALWNGADLIEIDVAMIEGTLWATHDDGLAAGTSRPLLHDLLTNDRLRAASAMLFLEVKESDADPVAFAAQLARALAVFPEYAVEGRPLFLRAFNQARRYLDALQSEIARGPLAGHVRYHVLFAASESEHLTHLHELIMALPRSGYTGVELDFRSPNLPTSLALARSLGLMTGVGTLPDSSAFGEVFVAAMREEVDQMTVDYRVDQVRRVIEDRNTVAHASAENVVGSTLVVQQYLDAPVEQRIELGLAGDAAWPGTPNAWFGAEPGVLFGPWLRYPPDGRRALTLSDVDARPNEGFLVSAVVHFGGALSSMAPGQTKAIVNKSENAGFALELYRPAVGAAVVRFGVRQAGGSNYTIHSYPIGGAGSGQGPCAARFTAPLHDDETYRLTGAYDGAGGVFLFIDNRCPDVARPSITGGVAPNDVPIMVGADPPPAAARFFFDGYVQSVDVQWWGNHEVPGDRGNGTYTAPLPVVRYLPIAMPGDHS